MKKILLVALLISIHQLVFSQSQLQYSIQPSSVTGVEAIVFNRPDFINATVAGTNYIVAASWTWGVQGTYRSLVRFDLYSVPSNIVLDSAKLNLTVDSAYSLNTAVGYGQNSFTNSNQATLKKVTAPWTPGIVTWNTQPTTSSTDSVILAQSTYNFQSYSLNVTSIVGEWLANPSSNYGFLLKTLIEQNYNTLVFCSSRHDKPGNRPQLILYYRNALTSIEPSNSFDVDIKLYPNPAANQVTIESNTADVLTYELYNPLGASVLSGTIGNQKADLNISGFSAGIYVLNIKSSTGAILKVQKLVIK